jgi:hypothetical protein
MRQQIASAAGRGRERVVAYVVNTSSRPVRIFIPGFIGPIVEAKSSVEAVPIVGRYPPRNDETDFAVLEPFELYGRSTTVPKDISRVTFSAMYEVYAQGREGDFHSVVESVRSVAVQPETRPAPEEKGRRTVH